MDHGHLDHDLTPYARLMVEQLFVGPPARSVGATRRFRLLTFVLLYALAAWIEAALISKSVADELSFRLLEALGQVGVYGASPGFPSPPWYRHLGDGLTVALTGLILAMGALAITLATLHRRGSPEQ